MENYAVKRGKKLRYGYTTGSCAAAASKASTYMLFTGGKLDTVEIDTPKGWRLKLEVLDITSGEGWVKCGIRKDGGDDPDATHGLIIYSKAEVKEGEGIDVYGGEGVGVVTKPGLPVSPGKSAINPVPMSMILNEVKKVLPEGKGVKITISVPGGERVALKTFNPRLGIVGGISILGTTGIVEPMSEEALKSSLELELSILSAEGYKKVVFAPGNYGKEYALKEGVGERLIISYGNFLGFMLEKAVEYGFTRAVLAGHIGKLVKVAAGIFNTHSHVADARAEIMAAYVAHFGADKETVDKVLDSNTTEEALDIIEKAGINIKDFSQFIADRVYMKCKQYVYDKLNIEVHLISLKRGIIAKAGDKVEW
ncbi:cobalt-precorrin-5B (C(1))-methyltransferase CbiD [Thermoanaerobacterium butyriciformans]|uniref:Cobalt-precorrin-5B C(1)-methyltransferase n=1 Tax=Thermoanaerobacterium butyriciformans TaxID=1702242 RepID=A0ABS4NFD7_9THEO|nr:cobalt-precorrin-5B (C(1))-methyltransferase CbiD [Thermoanaerobacterium butyriciformans]MBP2072376.1 cobalt-precorrin-5B (C1)-methyltransferase [Thermoanaerobacterium butyriciformans]